MPFLLGIFFHLSEYDGNKKIGQGGKIMLEILDRPYISPEKGLSSAEAQERLGRDGANVLADEKKGKTAENFSGTVP